MFVQGDRKIARLGGWAGTKPPVKFLFCDITTAGPGGKAPPGRRLIPLSELRGSSRLTRGEVIQGRAGYDEPGWESAASCHLFSVTLPLPEPPQLASPQGPFTLTWEVRGLGSTGWM